jgi:hypothetical protein
LGLSSIDTQTHEAPVFVDMEKADASIGVAAEAA